MSKGFDELLNAVQETGIAPQGAAPEPPAGGDNPPPPPPPSGTPAGDPTPPPVIPATDPATPPVTVPTVQVLPHEVFGDEFKDKDWTVAGAEVKTRLQEVTTLKEQLEAAKTAKPNYANETVAAYDAWVRNGGSDNYSVFNIVKSFKEEMTDIDAIVAKRIIENPAFIGLESALKSQILNEKPLEATVENGLTDDQIKINQALLTAEATSAKAFIKEQAGKLQIQQAPAVNHEQVFAERQGKWSAAADQILSKTKSIGIPIPKDVNGQTVFENLFDYQIPESQIGAYKQQFVDAYSKLGDVTPEMARAFQGEFVNRVIVDHLPYLIKAATDKVRGEIIEEYDKKYAGAVIKDPGGTPPNLTVKSEADSHIDNLLS